MNAPRMKMPPGGGEPVVIPHGAKGYVGWTDIGPVPEGFSNETHRLEGRKIVEDLSPLWAKRKQERRAILAATDGITAAPDVPEELRALMVAYRQALRDWPTTVTDPRQPLPDPPDV